VPRSLLRQLGPVDGFGRPTEQAATDGARFYDGTVWTLANVVSPEQTQQSFMYPLDKTAAMDFLLPAAGSSPNGNGQGGGAGNGGTSNGNGNGGTSSGNGNGGTTQPGSTGGVAGAKKTVVHTVLLKGTVKASVRTTNARAWVNKKSVLYVDRKAKLRFRSTKVTVLQIRGHSATLRGVGVRNGKPGVRFRVTLVAGKPGTVHVWFGKYVRSGRVVHGVLVVK
jgi:hypothetical protein